jgi:hypothetical protein
MKLLFYKLLLLLTWFTNTVNSTLAYSKVTLPKYLVSFSTTENQKLESKVKIGVLNFARSGICENSSSQKVILRESSVLENRARVRNVKVVSGAGNVLSKLDNPLFSALKGKVNQLDNVLKPQFIDDFANASDDVLKKLQDDNLFEVWKNDIRSSNIDELIAFKSNGNLRDDYITAVNSIASKASDLKALGKTDLEIAQEVFNLRRQTTINFKGATPDDMLDIIFEFNNIRYTQTGLGDKWGLSWNGAVTKATNNGVTDYSKIISGASTPLGDKQALGKALYDVVGSKTLPVLQKYRMTNLIQ